MILLLTDETWERVRSELSDELLAELLLQHELPSDRELIACARKREVPERVAQVRALREAANEASDQTRVVFRRLISHCHGAGVPVATIARWFGVDRTTVYSVVASELTESAAS